jgi:hypothetical protein
MKCLIVEMPYCLISAFQISAFNFQLFSSCPPLRAAPFSFQLFSFQLFSSAGQLSPSPTHPHTHTLPLRFPSHYDFGLDPLGAFVHNVTSRYETSRETARSAHFLLSQKHGFFGKYAERQILLWWSWGDACIPLGVPARVRGRRAGSGT